MPEPLSYLDRPISLAALSVIELTPPEMVTAVSLAGYRYISLRLLPVTPHEPRYDILGDTPMRRDLQHRLDDTGIEVLDVEFIRLDADAIVTDFLPLMETAAKLQAKQLLVAGYDSDEGRFVARFSELCDHALEFGLNANLEFYPWADVRTLAQAHRLVAACGRSNVGILIDSLHFDRSRSTLAEVAAVPVQWLRYVQLCDAPAERPTTTDALIHQARAERQFPGEGGLDLMGLLRALPRDIPIGIETPTRALALNVGPVERARRALEATRTLLKRLDDEDRAAART